MEECITPHGPWKFKSGKWQVVKIFLGHAGLPKGHHYIKSFVDLRPCYHWTDLRIKGHVLLCIIAYLIQRWIELRSGYSWKEIRSAFKKVHAVELKVKNERFIQRSSLTPNVTDTLRKLKIKYPDKILFPKKTHHKNKT